MINDRGLMNKWTGLMMPEHIQMLRDWEAKSVKRYPKEKTEWEWEDLQQSIVSALKKRHTITIELWRERWITEIGVITFIDHPRRQLLFETDSTVKRINFNEIDSVGGQDC